MEKNRKSRKSGRRPSGKSSGKRTGKIRARKTAAKSPSAASPVISAPLFAKNGKSKKEVALNEKIFGAPVNERLLELAKRALATNLRRGTASTKTRGEVRGGGKKPWKQKGTGRARHGSSRSPIWRGGGTVFGPLPHEYHVPISEGMKKNALISALSLRMKEKNLLLLEDTKIETPKTKEFVKILKALPLQEKKVLCVVKDVSPVLKRATRNLSGLMELRLARDLNVYHVLHWPKIVIESEAVPTLESRLLEKEIGKEAQAS